MDFLHMCDSPPTETPRRRPIRHVPLSAVKTTTHPSLKSAVVRKANPRFTHELDGPACLGKQCPECRFRRCQQKWKSRLRSLPNKKQWLTCRVRQNGAWGAGCSACQALLRAKPDIASKTRTLIFRDICYVRCRVLLTLTKLQRHQATFCHKFAEQSLINGDLRELLRTRAQTSSAFLRVLTSCQKGARGELQGVGDRRKVRRMTWCLAEAIRNRHRAFLREADQIGLHQDKRGAKLLIRFTSVNASLQRRSGVLGFLPCHGGHLDIIQSTEQAIRIFCSPGSGAPRRSYLKESHQPQVDLELQQRIQQSTGYFGADGESAEQLAGRRMRGRVADQARPLLPNLKVVGWDGAHAARRIVQRPWLADATLKEAVAMLLGRSGLVPLIQNSPEFREWFQNHKQRSAGIFRVGERVKNFCFARHRFDSLVKPLSRAVLAFPALLRTADQIVRLRHGKDEVKAAKAFLEWITTPRIILLAALADAGQEAIELVRFLDRESVPTEDVPWHVSALLQRITMLFVDGQAVRCGHLRWILEALRRPILVVTGSTVKTLGCLAGTSGPMIQQALNHLSCWVRLAKEVAETEFPGFRVLAAFAVFSLSEGNTRGQQDSLGVGCKSNEDHFARIAQVLGIDGDQLREQFYEMQPFAQNVKSARPGVSNPQAWQEALDRAGARGTLPLAALRPALQAWMAWTSSTSGIEQNFSQMERIFGARTNNSGDSTYLDLLTVVVEKLTPSEETAVVRDAREIWVERYGPARRKLRDRIDKGVKRGPREAGAAADGSFKTEAAFIRKRGADVRELHSQWVRDGMRQGAAKRVRDAAAELWTDKMDDEVNFQQTKRHKRLVDAARENQVLPKERDAGLDAAVRAAVEHEAGLRGG